MTERVWTNRLEHGGLRVQCRDCFERGTPPRISVHICQRCADRLARQKAERDWLLAQP